MSDRLTKEERDKMRGWALDAREHTPSALGVRRMVDDTISLLDEIDALEHQLRAADATRKMALARVDTLERERDEARDESAGWERLALANAVDVDECGAKLREAQAELEMTNRLVGSVTDIQWAIAVRAMRARCIGNDEAALRWLDKMARYLVTGAGGGHE